MNFNTTVQHDSNVLSHSHSKKSTPDIVFYIIIILLGTTGNSLVIWVSGVRMKPNVNNVWLVNLAVADLIFCVSRVTSLVTNFIGHWLFGDFVCKFMSFIKYANMFCSVFLLAVISVDRVICVRCPVITRRKRTLCAARVVSLGVWIVALIFSSPNLVFRKIHTDHNNLSHCYDKKEGNSVKYAFYYIRFFCGFLFPFLVIFICYTLAAVGIRRTRFSGKSRPLRILALLVLAFFLCWAPYHILGLLKMINRKHPAVKLGFRTSSNLAYFNSCVNPILYFCIGLNLKQRCNQSLLGIFHRALAEEDQIPTQDGTIEEQSNSVSLAAGTTPE